MDTADGLDDAIYEAEVIDQVHGYGPEDRRAIADSEGSDSEGDLDEGEDEEDGG